MVRPGSAVQAAIGGSIGREWVDPHGGGDAVWEFGSGRCGLLPSSERDHAVRFGPSPSDSECPWFSPEKGSLPTPIPAFPVFPGLMLEDFHSSRRP